jgi:hypothetical protein
MYKQTMSPFSYPHMSVPERRTLMRRVIMLLVRAALLTALWIVDKKARNRFLALPNQN